MRSLARLVQSVGHLGAASHGSRLRRTQRVVKLVDSELKLQAEEDIVSSPAE